MKYKFLLVVFGLFLFSCTSDAEENISNQDKDIIEEVKDSVDVVNDVEVKADSVEILDKTLLEAASNFFSWYYYNNNDLLNKRSAVIKIEDDYWTLDNTQLISYTNWLREVGYFSSEFVEKEVFTWKDNCGQQINDLINLSIEADGIPPCVFEADPFFFTQESVDKSVIDNMEFKITSYTDSLANIQYDFHDLSFKKEDDKWRVNDWPN